MTLDLLLNMREHICRGEPPGNCAKAVVHSLLQLPDAPKVMPEEARYMEQKLYDGYYVFECLTDRDWNEAICGICGVSPVFESADGNCKNCTPVNQHTVMMQQSFYNSTEIWG